MTFASTRNPDLEVGFEEAVFRGLAPDGGLFHPKSYPDLRALFEGLPARAPFVEVAEALIGALLPEIPTPGDLARRAFPFAPKLTPVPSRSEISILELFHGPSCAFKDFGASFLAAVMEQFLRARSSRAVILTATSGDTGSAVAQAFLGRANIDVVVLYPSGRVSPLQEKQLTTLGGNIAALEVEGSFDDCQRMVKEAFVDPELAGRITLTSANSINLGRLLPQSFYYVWAWAHSGKPGLPGRPKPASGDGASPGGGGSPAEQARPLSFCVPSGNFGNLTAGVLAWKWGLPVEGFLAATNRNDVVPEYLRSGRFTPRPSIATYSNAMDVGNPSNFERLLAIFEGDHERMSRMIGEEVVTDDETLETIRRVYATDGLILDPHTAVGYLASERFLERHSGARVVTLSTAHPGKFVETVEKTIGVRPELPPALARLLERTKESTVVENTHDALARFLLDRYA